MPCLLLHFVCGFLKTGLEVFPVGHVVFDVVGHFADLVSDDADLEGVLLDELAVLFDLVLDLLLDLADQLRVQVSQVLHVLGVFFRDFIHRVDLVVDK